MFSYGRMFILILRVGVDPPLLQIHGMSIFATPTYANHKFEDMKQKIGPQINFTERL